MVKIPTITQNHLQKHPLMKPGHQDASYYPMSRNYPKVPLYFLASDGQNECFISLFFSQVLPPPVQTATSSPSPPVSSTARPSPRPSRSSTATRRSAWRASPTSRSTSSRRLERQERSNSRLYTGYRVGAGQHV